MAILAIDFLYNLKKINRGKNFFNCGVAEQNMVSMAAGIGLSGLKPINTITNF